MASSQIQFSPKHDLMSMSLIFNFKLHFPLACVIAIGKCGKWGKTSNCNMFICYHVKRAATEFWWNLILNVGKNKFSVSPSLSSFSTPFHWLFVSLKCMRQKQKKRDFSTCISSDESFCFKAHPINIYSIVVSQVHYVILLDLYRINHFVEIHLW